MSPAPSIIVPVVADHILYTAASSAMLTLLRQRMRPALMYLIESIQDADQREALGVIRHNMLELQSLLCQIEDVENYKIQLSSSKHSATTPR